MIARQIARSESWVVASPGFIAQHGAPDQPKDLARFECIHDTNLRTGRNWPFQIDGVSRTVPIKGKMSVNSLPAAIRLAVGGQGIALCPDYAVACNVAEGRLLRLLQGHLSWAAGVHLVFLDARYMPARVRAFIDFIADRFSKSTPWDQFEHS